MFEIDFHISVG